MPSFSKKSLEELSSCDERLQKIFNEVVKYYDCTIICGYRDKEAQDKAFHDGKSKLVYPKSKHNMRPSLAVDVVPFPINWSDKSRFFHFAGFVLGVACYLNIPLRWGGDFNNDKNFSNDTFIDMPHFELIEEKL